MAEPCVESLLGFRTMNAVLIFRSLIFGSLLLSILPVEPQTAGGSVSGLIVCSDSNAPARDANVALIPLSRILPQTPPSDASKSTSPSTSTDFSGVYEIGSVAPGTYIVSATLDGYRNDLQLALSRLDGLTSDEKRKLVAELPQVTVKAGVDTRKDLILRRAAAISGRVLVDTGGFPGRGSVTATRMPDEGSTGVPSPKYKDPEPFTRSAVLDDRGMYRIAGLPEGMYRLSIRISEAYFGVKAANRGDMQIVPVRSGTGELIVYAPEALDQANARVIEVKDRDEITDADITIPTRLLHSIAGIVTEYGAPRAGMAISFQRVGAPVEPYNAVSLSDGSFRFDLLPSGTYTLRAFPTAGSLGTASGETTVQLQDADILDAIIDVHPTTGQSRR